MTTTRMGGEPPKKPAPTAPIDQDHTEPHGEPRPNGEGKRIQSGALRPDAEVGTIMKLFDETLSSVVAVEPPMRDVEGWPVEIQCRETTGLHELTPDGANDEEDKKSRLPPPKHYPLTRHDSESLEILIGENIEFIKKAEARRRLFLWSRPP